MCNRSAFGSHRRDGALVIVEPAVLAAIDETAAPSVSSEDRLPKPGIEGLVVTTRLQEPRVLAQDIAGRVACQRGEGWVDPYDRPLAISDQDAVGGGLDGGTLQAQLLLGLEHFFG